MVLKIILSRKKDRKSIETKSSTLAMRNDIIWSEVSLTNVITGNPRQL